MILAGKFQPLRLLGVEGGGPRWPNLVFSGDGLTLRPPVLDDFPAWAKVRAESRSFLEPWEPIWPDDDLTRASFRRRIRRYDNEIRADEAYPFFVFHQASRELAGGLTLGNVRRGASQTATLGYWMNAALAGRGIMTAATRLACRFGFAQLALERIEAACLPENAASIQVLEKVGFQREGFARNYLSIAGRRRDHILFALLATDDARKPLESA